MRPSKTLSIRIRPSDFMAALDILEKCNVSYYNTSMAQVIHLAMGIAFNTMRQTGIIPERDGFEYNEMLTRWKKQQHDWTAAPLVEEETRSLLQENDRDPIQQLKARMLLLAAKEIRTQAEERELAMLQVNLQEMSN